jgi:hypothetical protein
VKGDSLINFYMLLLYTILFGCGPLDERLVAGGEELV